MKRTIFSLKGKKTTKEEPEKNKVCTACNGSGYYDHNGSPKCSSCNGTGKEEV